MLAEGHRLGEFEILAQLGQGGMGAVYKAHQTVLRRVVAIKTLQPALSSDAEFVSRFHNEAVAAAGLNHPNLVQVYAAGESDGIHWFAMEFVDGESVQTRLKRLGKLEPAEALAICMHVQTALEYGWRKAQLIHRDIKPDNIFLSNDGEVKLGDLGLAKSADQQRGLTMTGASMGTPLYISPEQAEGKPDISLGTDIYSLGATLYHLLAGAPPYVGDSAVALLLKHVTAPVPDIREVAPSVHPVVAAVIAKMMQKSPKDRYQSYEELTSALAGAYQALNTPAGAAVGASKKEDPSALKPAKKWLPFAAILLVVAGLATLVLRSQKDAAKFPGASQAEQASSQNPPAPTTQGTWSAAISSPPASTPSPAEPKPAEMSSPVTVTSKEAAPHPAPLGAANSGTMAAAVPAPSVVPPTPAPKPSSPEGTPAPPPVAMTPKPEPPPMAPAPTGTPPPTNPDQPARKEWVTKTLFNETNLEGWTGYKTAAIPRGWQVRGGSILGVGSRDAEAANIFVAGDFDNFVLDFDWIVSANGAGGVLFRVPAPNTVKAVSLLKFQLSDASMKPPFNTGSIFGYKNATRNASNPNGKWNSSRLVVDGSRVEHWVNEQLVCEYEFSDPLFANAAPPASGWLGLQAWSGEIAFRNFQIRALPPPQNRPQDKAALRELVQIMETKLVPVPGTQVMMSRTEFTVGEWKLYLRARGLSEWTAPDKLKQTNDHPVVNVNWKQASEFCEWISYKTLKAWRLPTSKEWESAVGKLYYPYGNYYPPKKEDGNYAIGEDGRGSRDQIGIDGFFGTAPVASFKPNALGIFDLGGNVWECMGDIYPVGTELRQLRGGAWTESNPEKGMRTAHIHIVHMASAEDYYGFRMVRVK